MTNNRTFISGEQIALLMRRYRKTIKNLSHEMNITQTRVRYVREHGVRGEHFVRDWLEAINSTPALN